MAYIQVENLSFSYHTLNRTIPVLDDVNMSIEKGEMVAIQGPSGSGKSTLFYILGTLLTFNSGRVSVDMEDISKLSSKDAAIFRNQKIGFIFQHFHLLAKTNVTQNILLPVHYPMEMKRAENNHKERAMDLAMGLGIEDRLNHFPNQLSGGQQQRVSIARSLINDAEIILADEPTGNLDSTASEQIIEILKDLREKGKTILIITHDREVAGNCSRIFHVRDGKILNEEVLSPKILPRKKETSDISTLSSDKKKKDSKPPSIDYLKMFFLLMPLTFSNIIRNRLRSILTMLGITIGVAALFAMITLGQFTKEKILNSYAEMGVNTFKFWGSPNWELKATDMVSTLFRFFDWEKDLKPLRQIFPQIERISPALLGWGSKTCSSGRCMESETNVSGVGFDALEIMNREILRGRWLTPYHIENKSGVCVIGIDIAKKLFSNMEPIGKMLHIAQNEKSYACQVIGVLTERSSNNEWENPNSQIFIPFTYFQAVANHWRSSRIFRVFIQINQRADVEKIGKTVRSFFERKYGKSGDFRVDSDSVMISQMKKFLNLFTIMLTSIALISLAVGGIGITNMILVSVSERYKEIGLRKAIGATDFSIRIQFLAEAIILCAIAGILGLLIGFGVYEGIIFGASQFVEKLAFEWVLNPGAILISSISILIVGILSGLIPALKAEKLDVIEALRSE